MASITTENYLKALYFLNQANPEITLTELGKAMQLSKPTVNDMVKKLQSKGWIEYQKYKPLKLTKVGIKNAALVVRKHRLAEMFFVEIMGFGWEEVHDIAEELEHIKSQKLFDRMDELLGFPSVDPHGSPIPDKHGNITSHGYTVLSKAHINHKVTLRAVRNTSKDLLLYLNKKGLSLGTTIHLHDIEPFDKSAIISYNNKIEVVISYEVVNCLLVESS